MSRQSHFPRVAVKVAAVCLLLLAVLWLLSRWPAAVELLFGQWLFPPVAWAQGLLLGWLPLSLAEVAVGLVLLCSAAAVVTVVRGIRQGRGRRLLWCGTARVLAAVLVIVATGYLLWGLNYARPPLRDRLGWTEEPAAGTGLLLETGQGLLKLLNEHSDRGGERPWGDLSAAWPSLDGAVRAGLEEAGVRLDTRWKVPPGSAKRVWASRGLSHLGISGLYFPWTGEANVNVDAPQVQLPHVVAHERAHQLGIAAEDEANFVAFVACLSSPDPRLVYSGAFFGWGQVAGRLARADPGAQARLQAGLDPAVVEDLRRVSRYWRTFGGPAERVASRVNDGYLRSQGIPEGIRSYQGSLGLILSWWQREAKRLTDEK